MDVRAEAADCIVGVKNPVVFQSVEERETLAI